MPPTRSGVDPIEIQYRFLRLAYLNIQVAEFGPCGLPAEPNWQIL